MSGLISSGIAIVGTIVFMGIIIWGAVQGHGDRDAEVAAREHFDRTGSWPDGEGD